MHKCRSVSLYKILYDSLYNYISWRILRILGKFKCCFSFTLMDELPLKVNSYQHVFRYLTLRYQGDEQYDWETALSLWAAGCFIRKLTRQMCFALCLPNNLKVIIPHRSSETSKGRYLSINTRVL